MCKLFRLEVYIKRGGGGQKSRKYANVVYLRPLIGLQGCAWTWGPLRPGPRGGTGRGGQYKTPDMGGPIRAKCAFLSSCSDFGNYCTAHSTIFFIIERQPKFTSVLCSMRFLLKSKGAQGNFSSTRFLRLTLGSILYHSHQKFRRSTVLAMPLF